MTITFSLIKKVRKNLENTILSKTLESDKEKCIDKMINNVKCIKYGDEIMTPTNLCLTLIISDMVFIQ